MAALQKMRYLKLVYTNSVLTLEIIIRNTFLDFFEKCFLNKHSLSRDEAHKPGGEEAVVDDERHLSVYEPLRSQFPESPLGPFGVRIRRWFPLLHPRPVLIKAAQTTG